MTGPRGVFETTRIGGVSLIARTSRGSVVVQMTIAPGAYSPWIVDQLWAILNRLDPVRQDEPHVTPSGDEERAPQPNFTEADIAAAIDELLSSRDTWKPGNRTPFSR